MIISSIRNATNERFNFEFALGDAEILLKFHDSSTGRSKGRPARDLEVFKRAGVILAVTAWETFVEDTLGSHFQRRLDHAHSPSDVQSTFNSVAEAWLTDGKVKPPDLAKWTLDGWKSMLLEKLSNEIDGLNTPDSENVRRLFKRYLGRGDITKEWHWQGVSASAACERLDALINLRGRLVHRGRELFEERASVRRQDVGNAVSLLKKLVDRTESSLGIAPVETPLRAGQ
jgi:RiboL-PSP-HEPN